MTTPLVHSGAHFTLEEGTGRDGCYYSTVHGEPAQRSGDMHNGSGYILSARTGEWEQFQNVSIKIRRVLGCVFLCLNYLSQNKGANKRDGTSLIMHIIFIQEKKPPVNIVL